MMRHRSLVDGRGGSRLRLLGLAVLVLLGGRSAGAVKPSAPDDAFVSDYCTTCHNDVSKKGRLDLTSLAFDPSDPANQAVWVKVHDRVKAGEMPPSGRAKGSLRAHDGSLQAGPPQPIGLPLRPAGTVLFPSRDCGHSGPGLVGAAPAEGAGPRILMASSALSRMPGSASEIASRKARTIDMRSVFASKRMRIRTRPTRRSSLLLVNVVTRH